MSELSPEHSLWTPGEWPHENWMSLHTEYPMPSPQELQNLWQDYAGDDANLVPAPGVYGVVRVPEKPPTTFISVDVCEILRQTHASLRAIEEPYGTPIANIHDYCSDMQNVPSDWPDTRKYRYIQGMAQLLIGANLVQPSEDISGMASFLRNWRRQGAYVVANTSTLEGCEPGTIAFFKRYTPSAFDGILFPRNFEGGGTMNKGVAARNVIREFADPKASITAIHIDDLTHHHSSFHKHVGSLPNVTVATFQPRYPSPHAMHEQSTIGESPLHTMWQINQYLQQEGLHEEDPQA